MARLAMGELEAAVMDVLWDGGGWFTPGDVQEVLAAKRQISYSTVMTILVRLWRKGRLDREREGRAYAYRPTQTREQYAATRMTDLLVTVKNHGAAFSHFVAGLSRADQNQLRRTLDRKNPDS